jgi:hypothetical protein
MAAQVKSYILAPDWKIPPDGPLFLGSILAKPLDPRGCLNLQNSILVPQVDTYCVHNFGYKASEDLQRNHSIGIFAKFLLFLGVGVDMSTSGGKGTIGKGTIKHLQTQWFIPSRTYTSSSLISDAIWPEISEGGLRNLYMVVGIQTAFDASLSTSTTKNPGLTHLYA